MQGTAPHPDWHAAHGPPCLRFLQQQFNHRPLPLPPPHSFLQTAGIPKNKVGGFRAPFLMFDAEQREVLQKNGAPRCAVLRRAALHCDPHRMGWVQLGKGPGAVEPQRRRTASNRWRTGHSSPGLGPLAPTPAACHPQPLGPAQTHPPWPTAAPYRLLVRPLHHPAIDGFTSDWCPAQLPLCPPTSRRLLVRLLHLGAVPIQDLALRRRAAVALHHGLWRAAGLRRQVCWLGCKGGAAIPHMMQLAAQQASVRRLQGFGGRPRLQRVAGAVPWCAPRLQGRQASHRSRPPHAPPPAPPAAPASATRASATRGCGSSRCGTCRMRPAPPWPPWTPWWVGGWVGGGQQASGPTC